MTPLSSAVSRAGSLAAATARTFMHPESKASSTANATAIEVKEVEISSVINAEETNLETVGIVKEAANATKFDNPPRNATTFKLTEPKKDPSITNKNVYLTKCTTALTSIAKALEKNRPYSETGTAISTQIETLKEALSKKSNINIQDAIADIMTGIYIGDLSNNQKTRLIKYGYLKNDKLCIEDQYFIDGRLKEKIIELAPNLKDKKPLIVKLQELFESAKTYLPMIGDIENALTELLKIQGQTEFNENYELKTRQNAATNNSDQPMLEYSTNKQPTGDNAYLAFWTDTVGSIVRCKPVSSAAVSSVSSPEASRANILLPVADGAAHRGTATARGISAGGSVAVSSVTTAARGGATAGEATRDGTAAASGASQTPSLIQLSSLNDYMIHYAQDIKPEITDEYIATSMKGLSNNPNLTKKEKEQIIEQLRIQTSNSNGPLTASELRPASTGNFTEFNPAQKTFMSSHNNIHFRSIRGDGNCAPRSILFSLLDNDTNSVEKILTATKKLSDSDDALEADVKRYILSKITPNEAGSTLSSNNLIQTIINDKKLDIALMIMIRRLTKKHIEENPEEFHGYSLDDGDHLSTEAILNKEFSYYDEASILAASEVLNTTIQVWDISTITKENDGSTTRPTIIHDGDLTIYRIGVHYISGKKLLSQSPPPPNN